MHCGRRLYASAPRSAPAGYISDARAGSSGFAASAAATAPALEAIPGGLSQSRRAAAPAHSPEPAYQPSLFRDVLTGAKVIPIPTLTPMRMPGERRRAVPRAASPRPARRGSSSSQQSLELFDTGEGLGYAPPNEAIDCDVPVASPQHRMVAAAADASVVLIALGIFFLMFVLAGGPVVLNRQTILLLFGVGAVLALFYHFLWCLADGDTPGMRFAGLRLVDFDGRTPDRERRSVREVASLLSLLSAGLGLVWALVDEENLTWHDHISKTFPTAG
jgi:uncharacterized RDD family membrane protein YckC